PPCALIGNNRVIAKADQAVQGLRDGPVVVAGWCAEAVRLR
ncbi:hypothetical protein GWI33_011590, partial [Rhynchophorus ferrugineus]